MDNRLHDAEGENEGAVEESKKIGKTYIGVRVDDNIYQMIKDLAAYNNTTVSKTIRTIFQYVPKLHALIPKQEEK